MLLVGDITFPHWDGDPQFEPYTTYKQLDDALNRGQSLDAAERTDVGRGPSFVYSITLRVSRRRRGRPVRRAPGRRH